MSDLRGFHFRSADSHSVRRIVGVLVVGAVLLAGAAYVYESRPEPAQKPVVANNQLPSPSPPIARQ